VARLTQPPLIQQRSGCDSSRFAPPDGLYSLFILRDSGCPFYYRFYDNNRIHQDPAILGGFFIALSLFAKEVTDGEIETVTTEPCRYSFHRLRQGLLVLCSSKNFETLTIERIAKRISQLFVTKFSGQLLKPYPAAKSAPDLEKYISEIFSEIASQTQ
jgi:hypothetical protein